ncbi:MAG TPA: 3'-5' exonuclease, partial [Candidatus Acidoferrum sp.]|nr:3'-5' exonuclease [Candidatus Acidoferrum sp.]
MAHEDALSAISRAKNAGRSAADFAESGLGQWAKNVAAVFERYEAALQKANALDFDDLIGETVRLLEHDGVVREAWNRRLRYIMVDEFQDTNPPQYRLIRLLTEQQANICVVGDDDQGIYSWRGATVQNIAAFTRDYPQVKVIRLEQNYRSTANIVAGARALIENNSSRLFKELWTQLPAGDPIGIYAAANPAEEAAFIAACITRFQAASPADRVAVLYRSSRLSRQIEEAMRRGGLKYKVVRGTSFFQRAEVKDILAYLRLATGTFDPVCLLRIINKPARGIGPESVNKITQYAQEHGISVYDAIRQMAGSLRTTPRLRDSLRVLLKTLSDLSPAPLFALPDILRTIIERTGYRRMLEQAGDAEDGETRLENLQELIDMASEATARGETVQDFLDYMALASDADAYDESALVSLMTIHTAKGLEFPLVFICGMEEGLFPHNRSLMGPADLLEEERRVCYVGMTRARGWLILTRARFRPYSSSSNEASRFLDELPAELVVKLS